MPRLAVIDPANATGRVKEIFDGPLKGKHINIFKGMANSPVGLDAYLAIAGALSKSRLSKSEQESIALALAEANDCAYCLAAHTVLGKQAGLSEAQTLGARKGEIGDDPKLNALVRFTVQLNEKNGFVSDQNLADFKAAGYDDGHIVEVLVVVALNTYTNLFNHVNDTAIDFPAPPALK